MFYFLLVLFIIVCVLLCLLILIQSDKGGGISGAVGGLSGVSNFLGSQGEAHVLTKGTYIFGSVFLVLCVLMTFLAPGGRTASAVPGFVGNVRTVTPTPVSGAAMGFADDDGAVETTTGSGSMPSITGGIIQGGVEMEIGEDGTLRPVQKQSENAEQ